MKTALLAKRFADLLDQLKAVEATKQYRGGEAYFQGDYIDDHLFIAWKLKARNLLALACGDTSVHYRTFDELAEGSGYSTNYQTMLRCKAAFEAAREDYEGGFCNTVRNLVQAEIFSTELDQATELRKAGYKAAAAVIAGVVLETTLRELCGPHGIAVGKLDKMNADLTKAGHYNALVQKRITALAAIRNSAAHGRPDEFTQDDVTDMIAYVEGFVSDQL